MLVFMHKVKEKTLKSHIKLRAKKWPGKIL